MPFEPAPELKQLRIGALLNASSGSCEYGAETELGSILDAAGLKAARVWCVEGAEITAALHEISDQGLDLLIVLGGDGTIRSAAQICSEKGPLLMPLPGGTMNMLPKALYGERGWQDALRETLDAPAVQPVSGGKVGEESFFVAAMVGNATLWGDAREAVREGKIGEAFARGADASKKSFSNRLTYRYHDEEGQAAAMSIICPLTSDGIADDELALELAIFDPAGAASLLKLAFSSLVSGWRSDSCVETATISEVAISGEQDIPAILDGERTHIGSSATIKLVKVAFRALRRAG